VEGAQGVGYGIDEGAGEAEPMRRQLDGIEGLETEIERG